MDDVLAQPKPEAPQLDPSMRDDGDGDSDGDEDGGLDWSKIPKGNNAHKPTIPKRGEKDFEPIQGSNLQVYQLDRARTAMIDVLRSTRSTGSKSMSYAVWHPTIARAHVTTARGVDFTSVGHSVARPSPSNPSRMHKRLELLPEEALYLVERGTLLCWKAVEGFEPKDADIDGSMLGAPMSVQEAFTTMIGKESLTSERYQVYSYLRRLGFVVTRAKPPSESYPKPASYTPLALSRSPPTSFLRALVSIIASPFKLAFRALFVPAFNWWRPLLHRSWLHHNMDYASVYKSLRLIPAGHQSLLYTAPPAPDSPYEVFYHLYKPPTPFKKSAPPPPDFEIVVIDSRTTPIPSLSELDRLFEDQPVLPPPLPRQRKPPVNAAGSTKNTPAAQRSSHPSNEAAAKDSSSLLSRLLSLFNPRHRISENSSAPPRRVNPFMALRQGNKMIVIAAVDGAVASFFRFGQGAFEEWPMA